MMGLRRIMIGTAAAIVAVASALFIAPAASGAGESEQAAQAVGWNCTKSWDGPKKKINCNFNDRYKGSVSYNTKTGWWNVCDAVTDHRDLYSNFHVRGEFSTSIWDYDGTSGCRGKTVKIAAGVPYSFNLCYDSWNGNDCGPSYHLEN